MEIDIRERTVHQERGKERYKGKHETSINVLQGQAVDVTENQPDLLLRQESNPIDLDYKAGLEEVEVVVDSSIDLGHIAEGPGSLQVNRSEIWEDRG